MKTTNKILFLMLFMTSYIIKAQQNLVPNPSFEEYIQCPQGWNMGSSFYVQNWENAYTGGTPDYFNSCSNEIPYTGGVPCNVAGYQIPKNGNGYIGVVTYTSNSNFSVREYIRAQLNAPLIIGTRYFVSMYVSPTIEPICYLSNNIGLRFTNIYDSYNFSNDNFAQIYCDTIITDTLNWTQILGSFVADSAYRYVVIGNFYDDAHTNIIGCGEINATAYYYIDEISISTDSTVGVYNISSSNIKGIESYPNPAKNIISLNKQNANAIDYTITDIMGRIVQKERNYSVNAIDVTDLVNGVYFITINNQKAQKFLIIH